MRSGDLFIEVSSSPQASALTKLRRLATIDVTVVTYKSLNYSRGVISAADFLHVSTEEILENLQDQKVCGVKRITIRWDGQVLDTKHLILTFATPDLPQYVKAAYLNCPVRPYIPNPLRCFQHFGHSKLTCRGQATCARCSEVGHDSPDCKAREKCVNCKGEHTSYLDRAQTGLWRKKSLPLKLKTKYCYEFGLVLIVSTHLCSFLQFNLSCLV
ncbi:uncharacterized protein TNCV_1703841 [Trichonephila clavipes]|nr:uncharacterized protein TNCV_1703841 [Trichonephila clavipes]